MSGHSAPVYACAWDGTFLYSAAGDRFVVRWNPESGEQDGFTVRPDTAAYALAVVPGHPVLLIGCTNGTLIAIDTASRSVLWERNHFGKALFSVAVDTVHGYILTGDAEGRLSVLRRDGSLAASFPLDCGKIRAIHCSSDHAFLACQDGSWRMLELPSFNELYREQAHEGGVLALLHFPEDNTLLTGGKDGHLNLYDLLTGRRVFRLPAHYQAVYGLGSAGGQIISTSMDKTIKIWNYPEWKVVQRVEAKNGGHNRSVNGCLVLTDTVFATYGDDRVIRLWERSAP